MGRVARSFTSISFSNSTSLGRTSSFRAFNMLSGRKLRDPPPQGAPKLSTLNARTDWPPKALRAGGAGPWEKHDFPLALQGISTTPQRSLGPSGDGQQTIRGLNMLDHSGFGALRAPPRSHFDSACLIPGCTEDGPSLENMCLPPAPSPIHVNW